MRNMNHDKNAIGWLILRHYIVQHLCGSGLGLWVLVRTLTGVPSPTLVARATVGASGWRRNLRTVGLQGSGHD
jgi:hypothetical protein